jgi:hypothetical protein
MHLLPKFKRCPCCDSLNLFKTNGITYENNFKSLSNWTLKKLVDCRKCKIKFGLFINDENKEVEKVVWMEMLECEESFLDQLNKLQKNKEKYKEKNKEIKYLETLKKIEKVQNQIRLDQVKLKVKVKMQNRVMSI